MAECRYCGEHLRSETEQKGVRCPRCREPLFERPGGPELADAASLPPGSALCALHPGNLALGACKRCGNFFCPVCRTRWQERALCLSCVERLIGNEEIQPEEFVAHNRQALLGLLFGLGGWVLVALSLLAALLAGGRQNQINSALLVLLLLGFSLVSSILGLGQSASAIRLRGKRLALATAGLVLSGCHLGVFVGLLLLSLGRM